MPGEAPHEEQSSGFVAPDLAPEGRRELVEDGSQVGLTTESGGRTHDASSEEELGHPWFIDRSDVAMTGLTMRDYLRYWHEDYWHLLEPQLEGEEFYDYVFDSEQDIGEPIPCLLSMPGLLLEKFRTGVSGRAALVRQLGNLPGTRTSSKPAPLSALRQIVNNGSFNPAGRKFDQTSPDWASAVAVVQSEQNALAEFIEPFLDEVEAAIAEDLQGLSAYQKPRHGSLMFGPYHTREHPLYDKLRPYRPYCVSIWAGDSLGKCRAFTGYYTLILERSPRLRPLIDGVRAYRAELEGRLVQLVAGLPVVE